MKRKGQIRDIRASAATSPRVMPMTWATTEM